MPGARKAKKGQTEKGANAEQKPGALWDKASLQEFDGRANTNAGDHGKEPGGRWGPASYESPPVIISKYHIRKPGGE